MATYLLIDIIAAPSNGGPEKILGGAGSILFVVVPNKWIMYISPEHPAYSDLLAEQLRELPCQALKFFADECERWGGMPEITAQYVKAEMERKGCK